ncbi:pyridoxamine 5'-phosphate oxidase family protein [Amycolatopsis sp. NPDC058278]|uniref:pyridoxamine 5'-phosphate oxidase family protein n=1 Tax=Amycolatopsis sp. NPDC058278 TaxID=3346417 RepID=UPI0036D97B5A
MSPGTKATSWAETTRAPEEAQISWLTTVRADGRPHVTPLVAVWLDGAIHFSTGATEQKYLNLTANPNIVLTTGRNAWDDALDVIAECCCPISSPASNSTPNGRGSCSPQRPLQPSAIRPHRRTDSNDHMSPVGRFRNAQQGEHTCDL